MTNGDADRCLLCGELGHGVSFHWPRPPKDPVQAALAGEVRRQARTLERLEGWEKAYAEDVAAMRAASKLRERLISALERFDAENVGADVHTNDCSCQLCAFVASIREAL